MFSKPIMIAASVAAANATLLTASKGAHADATDKSDATGCGLCLMKTKTAGSFPLYAIGASSVTSASSAWYSSPSASTTVSIAAE